MKPKKFRHPINITIFLVLVIATCNTLPTVSTTDYGLEIRHYVNFAFILGTLFALLWNRNLFTLVLGVNLLVGNFSGLSSLHSITTQGAFFNIGSLAIPLYWGQPFYSLLLIIYLIFNAGFYIGVATKEYWGDFLTRTNDMETALVQIPADNTNQPLESQTTDEQSPAHNSAHSRGADRGSIP